jgi:DNA invertase Pin-like site-specific DNA recombinase
MAKIGYARVSSTSQNLDVQLEKLKECDRIFQEKQSARSTDNREQLALCLDYVRDGDVLIVTKIDRIARSVFDFHKILKKLEEKQVKFICLDQDINTSTPEGRLTITMLSAISEFENDLRRARQIDGIELAKRNGVRFGRKKALTSREIKKLREKRKDGVKIIDLMDEYDLSKASIYRYLGSINQKDEITDEYILP